MCACVWQAPEVSSEQPYDTSADIWSLGVIFLHLLTLQTPSAQSLHRGNLPDLIHVERTHGAGACSCMRSMLQIESARRPSSEQVVKAMQEASAQKSNCDAGDGGIGAAIRWKKAQGEGLDNLIHDVGVTLQTEKAPTPVPDLTGATCYDPVGALARPKTCACSLQ